MLILQTILSLALLYAFFGLATGDWSGVGLVSVLIFLAGAAACYSIFDRWKDRG